MSNGEPKRRTRAKREASLPAVQVWEPELRVLGVDLLDFNPAQPRGDAERELDGLVASLSIVSEPYLVQPPTVEALPSGRYLVQMGERRVRSVIQAGWQEVACQVIEPSDPYTALIRRLAENMQRRDLHPLDEAASIKNAWLYANAVALGSQAEAQAILAQGLPPIATLTALTELLKDTSFVPTRPAIPQKQVLEAMGLAADADKCRRLLQVLALDGEMLSAVRDLDMTEAAIRCLGRFPADQQRILVAEIQALPGLAQQVRSMWGSISKLKMPFDEVLESAKRKVHRIEEVKEQPVEALPDASVLEDIDTLVEQVESASYESVEVANAEVSIDEGRVMETVISMLEAANAFQACGEALLEMMDGRGLSVLPEVWREYFLNAAQIIASSLKQLPLR